MVSGVILAAGQAQRMGQAKQLLILGDKPMIWHVAAAACQADFHEVLVITGAYHKEIAEVLKNLPVKILYNDQWTHGQSTSVKKGIASVSQQSQAVAFLLGDQPLIHVALMNQVIAMYQSSKSSIIMPCGPSKPGNPVLFDLGIWRSSLLALSGDEGARQIIRLHQKCVQYLEVEDENLFFDVDTPQEFEIIKQKW